MTHDTSIAELQKQLGDIEADIQNALHSLQQRFTGAKILTHRRRDRPDEHGRPGFYREYLRPDEHTRVVVERADIEKTTSSLNHKNWAAVINAYAELGEGCVDDANKIALRVDDLKNVLRLMHVLQQTLTSAAQILPAFPAQARPVPQELPPAPSPPPQQTPGPLPAVLPQRTAAPAPQARAPPERKPWREQPIDGPVSLRPEPPAPPTKPALRKATKHLTPTQAEAPTGPSAMITEPPYESTQRSTYLDEIRFDEGLENVEGDETEDETGSDEEAEDEEGENGQEEV